GRLRKPTATLSPNSLPRSISAITLPSPPCATICAACCAISSPKIPLSAARKLSTASIFAKAWKSPRLSVCRPTPLTSSATESQASVTQAFIFISSVPASACSLAPTTFLTGLQAASDRPVLQKPSTTSISTPTPSTARAPRLSALWIVKGESMSTLQIPSRIPLDDYSAVIGAGEVAELRTLAKPLAGREVIMINSTAVGGGVAEILNRLVPLAEELGIKIRWEV